MEELNNLFNHVLKDKLGYPETYEIYRVGRNTIVLESKHKGAKKLLIDKIKFDIDFREKLLKELENIIRLLDFSASDMKLSFQDYNIVVQFKTSNEIIPTPSISKSIKTQFNINLQFTIRLIVLPVEIHAIISSYLNLRDIHKIFHIYGLDTYGHQLDTQTFWSTYLITKHPYLAPTRDTRGVELQGNPESYDMILSYYDSKNFNRLIPENMIYDDTLRTVKPPVNQMISGLLNGSKYHYDQVSILFKEYPLEFKILLKYDLLRKEDHGYLVSILDDPTLIREYYLESTQPRLTLNEYKEKIRNFNSTISYLENFIPDMQISLNSSSTLYNTRDEIERTRIRNTLNNILGYIYLYKFLMKYTQNVIKAMEYFKVDKF
jgi:hypothetical protein